MQPWHYIVLVGAVLLVYALMKPGNRQSLPATTIQEIENTMDLFTAELEEENRQLIELVSEMKQEHDRHSAKLQGRLEALERQNIDVSKQMERLLAATEAKQRQAEIIVPQAASVTERSAAPSNEVMSRGSVLANGSIVSDKATQDKQEKQDGMNIRHRYSELFSLEMQGKSIDYIAKKLGMNKGEVMLIIQLAKQEDRLRA